MVNPLQSALLVEVCPLLSKPKKHVLLKWKILGTICKHPSFLGFGKSTVSLVAERSLSKHLAFQIICSAFSIVVILFSPWQLICREQKSSFLCLLAARDLLLTSGEAWTPGDLAMALLGGHWVAKGDLKVVRLPKAYWKMSSISGWFGTVVNL